MFSNFKFNQALLGEKDDWIVIHPKNFMKPSITPGAFGNSYLQQFQIAQLNLAKLIEEERLLKRIKRNKKKITGHD